MYVYSYGTGASSVDKVTPQQRQWNKVRELLAAERRGLETSAPDSPRIKPSLAVSVGWVLR
jgi:hypothetical protein